MYNEQKTHTLVMMTNFWGNGMVIIQSFSGIQFHEDSVVRFSHLCKVETQSIKFVWGKLIISNSTLPCPKPVPIKFT